MGRWYAVTVTVTGYLGVEADTPAEAEFLGREWAAGVEDARILEAATSVEVDLPDRDRRIP